MLGSANSSNFNRLREVAKRMGITAIAIRVRSGKAPRVIADVFVIYLRLQLKGKTLGLAHAKVISVVVTQTECR